MIHVHLRFKKRQVITHKKSNLAMTSRWKKIGFKIKTTKFASKASFTLASHATLIELEWALPLENQFVNARCSVGTEGRHPLLSVININFIFPTFRSSEYAATTKL